MKSMRLIITIILSALIVSLCGCGSSESLPKTGDDEDTVEETVIHNLDEVAPEEGNPSESSLSSVALYQVKAVVELHVRTGPGTNYDIIYTLPYGSVKDVYEIKTDGTYQWNRIAENEWIANDGTWLERQDATEPTTDLPDQYPRFLSQEEIIDFENEFIGSWHSFNPPKDEYSSGLLMLVITTDVNNSGKTILPSYPESNVLIGGASGYYPSYTISEIIQRDQNTWDIKLNHVPDPYYGATNLSNGVTLRKNSNENITIVFSRGEVDSTKIEYGKGYSFDRITDGLDLTETRYWAWVKENGYKSNYVE